MPAMNLTVMFLDAAVAIYLINGWAAIDAGAKATLNLVLLLVCVWLWIGGGSESASAMSSIAR